MIHAFAYEKIGISRPANKNKIGGINMFKKSLIAVLFSVMMAMVLSTSAFAAVNVEQETTPEIDEALKNIQQINSDIEAEIARVQAKSKVLFAAYESAAGNVEHVSEKNKLYSAYNKEVNALINELKETTREMTKTGMKKAREAGINTRPDLIRVEFADRFAMIDPIVVVGW